MPIHNYTVGTVSSPTSPISPYSLADTFNVDPVYNTSSGILEVWMSFMIPGDLDPDEVSIKQYYTPDTSTELQFYAVYDSASTATLVQVDCKFKASSTDASSNPINLSNITDVFTMVSCIKPPKKTSRGTMVTIRIT